MSLTVAFCLFLVFTPLHVVISDTDKGDVDALTALKQLWQNEPPTWNNFDPCGNNWDGIVCIGTRVISITLSSMGLQGTLSGDIQELSELQILDLSYNKGMTGVLPPAIGKLTKLTSLILSGCSFSGQLPDAVGSLTNLRFLSLNSNKFSGIIPNTIGNLSKLYWFDIANNQISGPIPVSNGTAPGLDMLVNTRHFHFGKNQLSGEIPPQLFNENMTLIHLILNNNQFTGSIPSTLGLVKKLEVVRLDWNMFTGFVPSNIGNLTSLIDIFLSNNRLTGPIPDLTGLASLSYLDMSNNSFEVSDIPSWFSDLPSLTTLIMEKCQIRGEVPAPLFSLPQLETVVMKNNRLSGTLDLGPNHSLQLRRVDLQINNIAAYTQRPVDDSLQLILVRTPFCEDSHTNIIPSYCILPGSRPPYSTPQCASSACKSNEIASPNCQCGSPYSGVLEFRAPKFSDLQNSTYFTDLEMKLMAVFQANKVAVDSVSLSNISRDSSNDLDVNLKIFPHGQALFNRTAIRSIGFILSNQTFKPPPSFGPFIFMADEYPIFAAEPVSGSESTNSLSKIVLVGIAIAVCALVLLLLLLCVGVFFFCRKRRANIPVQPAKSTEPASSANWTSSGSTSSSLQVTGSRRFPFEDIKKITNNFSQANHIGSGSYGKVYRGTLPNGQLVAVKRAETGSRQGSLEFKTEIELLSRVHHKNLVRLLGFCLDNEELILVYEFVPNGTLKGSLSGVSGILLDWRRRIKVALGAARGLAYLHELASPPIIHRDIKSNNILLDENLNAKVSDFGLSKSFNDAGTGHMMTEVKGTMGYLDPEYYMTQRLSEKSDVYSFGVLMLELITGKSPIDKGRYIVREVKNAMNRSEDLYGLHELLDSDIGLGTTLKGFEKYVDVSLMCVEELGDDRPAMGGVVKQLEDILEMAGLNPYSDSANSTMFDPRHPRHLYGDESLSLYSGTETASRRS